MTFKRDVDQSATFGVQTRQRSKRDGRRSKLRTAVYPPRMAPIGLKLCQNAFQTIPDVSFFDVKKNVFVKQIPKNFGIGGKFVFMICSFWESWSTLSLIGIFSMQNDPDLPKVQVSTFLGEGV